MDELVVRIKEADLTTRYIKNDILVIDTPDIEYYVYSRNEDGTFIGMVCPKFASGELFCRDLRLMELIDSVLG